MDTIGRPTIKLTALNVADEVRENTDLIVTYDYPWVAGYRKPITITAGILAVFVASWVIGGLDLRIGKAEKGK
jgi:oligosaccharyltransferase complex subunit alpha (ribophorin I)